jgi:RimJ/RimL family protein N-acetyltransferase
MYDMQIQLFEGQRIRLTEIDYDKDYEIESRWTHDSGFMRLLEFGPVYPLSPAQIKKRYEALEKQAREEKNLFHFRVRSREDDRLVGLASIEWIEWTNGNGFLKFGIGSAQDRSQGLGTETLQILLRYAFDELNLYRLTAMVQEYNQAAIALLHKAGFMEEVRRRQCLLRDNRRWDLINFGLLQSEWREQS